MAVRKYIRCGARVSQRKNEMKTAKISNKKPMESNDKSKKALVVANLQQEIKIARLLANNDKKVRDKVLKRLNKWLTVRSQSSFGKSIFAHYYVNYIINTQCYNFRSFIICNHNSVQILFIYWFN